MVELLDTNMLEHCRYFWGDKLSCEKVGREKMLCCSFVKTLCIVDNHGQKALSVV